MSSIFISSVRIVDNHAEYAIEYGNVRVWKRFRDFENLRKTLLLDTPFVPELPPKMSWWASRRPDIVSSRKVALENFLRKIEQETLTTESKIAWDAFFTESSPRSLSESEEEEGSRKFGNLFSSFEKQFEKMKENSRESQYMSSSSLVEEELRQLKLENQKYRIEMEEKEAVIEKMNSSLNSLEKEYEASLQLKSKVLHLEKEVERLKSSSAFESFTANGPENERLRTQSSSESIPSLESNSEDGPVDKLNKHTDGANTEIHNSKHQTESDEGSLSEFSFDEELSISNENGYDAFDYEYLKSALSLDNQSEEEMLKRICELTFNTTVKAKLTNLGACEATVGVLERNSQKSELISLYGCKTILNLAYDEGNCIKLGTLGACKCVTQSLITFMDNHELALVACGAISNLAFNDSNSRTLRKNDVYSALMTALGLWGETDPEIVYTIFVALLNLFIDGESIRNFGIDGVKRVTKAFKTWGSIKEDVGIEGSVVIRNLAEDIKLSEELGKLGVCEDLVEFLRIYGLKQAKFAQELLLAIRNLSKFQLNQERFEVIGTYPLVISIINRFILEESVALHGCLTLRNLISRKQSTNRKFSSSLDILNLVRNSVIPKWGEIHQEIAYACCAILWELATDNSLAKEMMSNKIICYFLIHALMTWGKTVRKISLIASGTIWIIIGNAPGSVIVFKSSGIENALNVCLFNDNVDSVRRLL